MRPKLTPAQEELGQSDRPADWLIHFGNILANRMWMRAWHCLVQLDVFDETNKKDYEDQCAHFRWGVSGHFPKIEPTLSQQLGKDWTNAVGEVILSHMGAGKNLLKMAGKDIKAHQFADVHANICSGFSKDDYLRDHNVACSEEAYALRLQQWLRGLIKVPQNTVGDLIRQLKKLSKTTIVQTWDAYNDRPKDGFDLRDRGPLIDRIFVG